MPNITANGNTIGNNLFELNNCDIINGGLKTDSNNVGNNMFDVLNSKIQTLTMTVTDSNYNRSV